MTHEERLARIPTDRHVHYSRECRRGWWSWLARWRDDTGRRRYAVLGQHLPTYLPDYPCRHRFPPPWQVPTTEAERLEAQERGRRANAARVIHSNQHLKQRHGSWDREQAG